MVHSPNAVRVERIDWNLNVEFREKTFSGRVSIEVEDAPDPLTVDAARLTVDSASLDGRPAAYHENLAEGTLEFAGVTRGPHRLEIAYRGAVDPNSLVGIYVSPAGPGYCLTTMLFPTGSRRLLPCFEDPTAKTVYRLVVTVDADLKVIFNTPPSAERLVGGRREVTFSPTPRMSAYLLYLGIGPFDTFTVPGHPWSVTVAASPGRASAGRYCAERASKILRAYEAYYGVPYPLPKLDLVALENFWAGAMENWGAIACRESAVLVDPRTTARERRVNIQVLAHEIAHQWFGNLVTPTAWDDFWLNESFATFVGHRIVDQQFTEERPWAYFLQRYYGRALEQDSRSSTHPVKVSVASADELGEIADDVTYGKGAAVLRMIDSYLGEPIFRKGLSAYLAKHQYANARAEDLWDALAEASQKPVARIMTEWITRPGYPVVLASWSDGQLTLRQSRFRGDGTPSPAVWPIPLTIETPHGKESVVFETAELTQAVPSREGLRINPGRTAFARVRYDDGLFDQVRKEFLTWDPIDQWGVIVDTLAFVFAGTVPLERLLEIVDASRTLTDEIPVEAVTEALHRLYVPLHDVPGFLAVAQGFLRAQLQKVGLDRRPGETDSTWLIRETLARRLVEMDAEFARELALRFPGLDDAAPELRPAIVLAYARAGGSSAFDPLVTRLRSTASDGERVQLLRALAGFQEPALVRRALDLIPSPGVTPSGALDLFWGLRANPAAGAPVFEWYREHSQSLSQMWAGTGMTSTVLTWGIPLMGLDREDSVEEYFRDHTPPEARMGVAQGFETLQLWTRLRRRVLRGPAVEPR